MGDGDATLVASVTGGVAAALVGDRDKVSESYGLGASGGGENAFTNNYRNHNKPNIAERQSSPCHWQEKQRREPSDV